jgi:hypothetical protein
MGSAASACSKFFTKGQGDPPHGAWAGLAREFAFQARTLEIGHGRDVAIMRLRGLVDANVFHAVDLCRAYRDTANRIVMLEVRTTQADMRGHAIAARAALATYIPKGLGALPVSGAEPRQLLLFATRRPERKPRRVIRRGHRVSYRTARPCVRRRRCVRRR